MEGGKRRDFVLRKKPPGKLVASAHQVDREFRVISALARTDVPVAPARLLCADDSVIGQMFYLMDAVARPHPDRRRRCPIRRPPSARRSSIR